MKRAVFLDRDGVVNENLVRQGVRTPPRRIEEFRLLPGVSEAVKRLKKAGWVVVVVTNQPDVARGTLKAAVLDFIHASLSRSLPIDAIECCRHDDADRCDCRKPQPGMLLRAADRFGIDLSQSVMVGDRWRDIAAGRAAGCRTIYISPSPEDRQKMPADAEHDSLLAATDEILAQTHDLARLFP